MDIPLKYFFTARIVHCLQKIEAFIQLTQYLKKSNSSDKKMPNFLILFNEPGFDIPDKKNSFFINYLRAQKWIDNNFSTAKRFVMDDMIHLHKILFEGILSQSELGKYRESYDIYPTPLSVIYLPEPSIINKHLIGLLEYINEEGEYFPVIKASLALFLFLRISPFQFGNLYTAQLIFSLILRRENYILEGGYFISEYNETGKLFYFLGEDLDENLTVSYLEYLLEKTCELLEKAKNQLFYFDKSPDKFFPRLTEILSVINKKKIITLKQLSIIFPDITYRTLSYHLKKLEGWGFITKRGITRGCVYTPRNNDYLNSGEAKNIFHNELINSKKKLLE